MSDYALDFEDKEIAESCVFDVLRARVVSDSGRALVSILELLNASGEGFECPGGIRDPSGDGTEAAKPAQLKLIRCKNKFKKPDPTRFRNVPRARLESRPPRCCGFADGSVLRACALAGAQQP